MITILDKIFALAAILVFAAAPLALAHDSSTGSKGVSPNFGCWPTQNPHDYGLPGDISYNTPVHNGGVGFYSAGDYNMEDCDDDGEGGDFDGDYEYGVGGGFFPAGAWAADPTCDYGLVAHHEPGFHVHSAIPNEDTTDFSASFTVGTDPTPPTLVPSTDPEDDDGFDCVTDGSVTPDVDLDDCLEDFTHAGTTSCPPGSDGGYNVWIHAPSQAGHISSGDGGGVTPSGRDVAVCAYYTSESDGSSQTWTLGAHASDADRDGDGIPDTDTYLQPETYPSGVSAFAQEVASGNIDVNGSIDASYEGDGVDQDVSAAAARGKPPRPPGDDCWDW